ncbi:uncharacterized protein LOC107769543 [Nicotiana tabacum]|uniref:Uncharacterized protein LOC107769543 n=2 Tax=Nicotiana TaxID=4085 RepID=A0A1S3XWK8_TOBAC|nr:PREDICTED: uncharacterized protein LOC104249186 [Nicotiana sylvestris]XP_016444254.1 PREDICTED: uncharacterized protein LOC107769543 [Nicotiana tabacum]
MKFKAHFEGKKSNLFCNYCKKPGHTIDQCYRIIGFPSSFKFTKSRKFQGGAYSNQVMTSEDNVTTPTGTDTQSSGNPITQDQFSQLFQLLQLVKIGQQGEQVSEANTTANCAGPFNEEASGSW